MAKESMIAREQKRIKTVKKYAAKRAALKAVLSDTKKSEEEKQVARLKLQKLPRDASPVRLQRRCQSQDDLMLFTENLGYRETS